MPPDMAMHQPRPGVIGLERKDQVPGRGQHGGVSAGRVRRVQRRRRGGIGARALGEDEEVVAVQVDGVGHGLVGLDDEVGPFVGVGELDDGVGGVEGGGVVEDLLEGGVGPGNHHRGGVEVPAEEIVAVQGDGGGFGLVPGFGGHGLGEIGG